MWGSSVPWLPSVEIKMCITDYLLSDMWDLNTCPFNCVEDSLSTQPSPQPFIGLSTKTYIAANLYVSDYIHICSYMKHSLISAF